MNMMPSPEWNYIKFPSISEELRQTAGRIGTVAIPGLLLSISLYQGTGAFIEDGLPSEDEMKQVAACAERLDSGTVIVSHAEIPRSCDRYDQYFDQQMVTDASGFNTATYTLPTREQFTDEHSPFVRDETKRAVKSEESLRFLAFGIIAIGVTSFRRRLKDAGNAQKRAEDVGVAFQKYLQEN